MREEPSFKLLDSVSSLIFQGRFVTAWLRGLQSFYVFQAADVMVLRVLGVVALSLLATLFFKYVQRFRWSSGIAFLLSAAIFLLPGFYDFIFWGSFSFYYLAALAAFGAYLLFQKTGKWLCPSLLIVVAAGIYQPWAMFYWVPLGGEVLFAPDKSTPQFKRRFVRMMGVGLAGVFLYAGLIFFINVWVRHFCPQVSADLGPYSPHTAQNVFQKMQWFIREPLVNVLNLWNVYPKGAMAAVMGFLILATVLIKARRSLWHIAVFAVLAGLSFLPNLVAAENAAYYRCLMPLFCLTGLLLFWVLRAWAQMLPAKVCRMVLLVSLALIVVYGGAKAFAQVLYQRVLPSAMEWKAYKAIGHIRFQPNDRVHIICPDRSAAQRYDEYGTLTSHYLFDTLAMFIAALRDSGNDTGLPLLSITLPGETMASDYLMVYYRTVPDGSRMYRELGKKQALRPLPSWAQQGEQKKQAVFFVKTPIADRKPGGRLVTLNLRELFAKDTVDR